MTNDKCGLYVHIPFCLSKCIYCDFVSFAGCEKHFEVYADALIHEIELYAQDCENKTFDTIYFGGGTPSVLPVSLLEKILKKIKSTFQLTADAEITIEVNPATVTEDGASRLKECDFNRVSIGMQSLCDDTLKFLNRPHTAVDFENTVYMFQKSGISNLSADVILGLPNQTEKEILQTVDFLTKLNLKHMSAYALKVERGTQLSHMVSHKKIVLPDDEVCANLYDALLLATEKNGFSRYEVSNFALAGFESKHNLHCWQYKEYLGLGLNAHSFMFGKRFSNVSKLENYTGKLDENKKPLSTAQKLSLNDMMFEFVMLGLRLEEGISVERFDKRFNISFVNRYKEVIERLEKLSLICFDGKTLKVKKDKFYVLNGILTEFLF